MDLSALHKISYGLYIISSKDGDKINGQIANAAVQVTSDPVVISLCLNKKNYTHEMVSNSKVFALSILDIDTPMNLIANFGFKEGRVVNKFADVKHSKGKSGVPVKLPNCVGYLEAEVISSTDVGTHTIFIAKVIDSQTYSEKEVLTYDYYHRVKKGGTPKNAPSYVPPSTSSETKPSTDQQTYICDLCGHEYLPSEDGAWADLSDSWECPICGAPKTEFS